MAGLTSPTGQPTSISFNVTSDLTLPHQTKRKKLYKCEWLLTIHSAIKRKKSWYVGHKPWPCGPVRPDLGLNVGQTHSHNHTYMEMWPITYMWRIVDPHCMLIETCVSHSHHRVPTLGILLVVVAPHGTHVSHTHFVGLITAAYMGHTSQLMARIC